MKLDQESSRNVAFTVALSAFTLIAGCGLQGAQTIPAVNTFQPTSANNSSNASKCTMLNEAEVTAAISAHNAGISDLRNIWGLQGCRWVSTVTQKGGSHDYIEVAVFNKDRESWARGQAEGDPEPAVGAGALYNSSDGTLWFSCGSRFCVVKAGTASGGNRERIAVSLAKSILTRVH